MPNDYTRNRSSMSSCMVAVGRLQAGTVGRYNNIYSTYIHTYMHIHSLPYIDTDLLTKSTALWSRALGKEPLRRDF